jgi:aldehyde:ferredoxin oxidoreductase
MFGYAGRILHVDLNGEDSWIEPLSHEKIEKFLGGRGVNASYLWELLEPGINPLGEKNVLIFGTGALTGTLAPASGRTTITCKSPATNLYLKSSAGGHWGPELKFAGYDHLIVHSISKRPVYIWINDDNVEIRDATKLWGNDVESTEDLIRRELGDDRIEVACIGPAGENKVLFASIMLGHCAAGRGGVGAVMGSKLLKAIAVRGSLPVRVAKPNDFMKTTSKFHQELASLPERQNLMKYGTSTLVQTRNKQHLLPTKNFQEVHFENAERISGEYLVEKGYLANRSGCAVCGTACHRYTKVGEGPYKGSQNGGPEYETVASLGSGCGINDTAALLKASELCNRYGLDTISTGGVIQWAMECYERGLITSEDTDGLELTWGNGDTVIQLISNIAYRHGIGSLLAEGTRRASEKVGRDSWKWAIQSKGLEQSRAETRARKGYALAFAVNPRGADHLHTQCYAENGASPAARMLIKRICGSEEYASHVLTEKRAEIVRYHEDWYATVDCLGLCSFVTISRGYLIQPKDMREIYEYATGIALKEEALLGIGRRIINLERVFNVREGATRSDDTLPWRIMNEPIPSGDYKGFVTSREELDQMLDEYYGLHGWNRETGRPTKECLKRLDLADIIDQLEQLGKI